MTLTAIGLLLLVAWPLYNLTLVWVAARANRADRRRSLEPQTVQSSSPNVFWIVVPCLNEERVVNRTSAAALALAGPPGSRTYVLVVDDASEDGTRGVLSSIQHPYLHVLRRRLPDARRGKGEALNSAYRFIRDWTALTGGDPNRVAIGVIDGDGRGSENILREVARGMSDPTVGAVQCRVRIHNRDRVLGAVQDLEFACIANASQLLRNSLSSVGLGGNGQFTRLSSLMCLGEAPWSKCLVEDLELGLRMHMAGEKLVYLSNASVTQQGVVDVRRLLRQRTRWAQGNLQCVSYLPQLVRSRNIANRSLIEMIYYLLAPWMNAIGSVIIFGLWLVAILELAFGHGTPILLQTWGQLASMLIFCAFIMLTPPVIWAIMHRFQLRDERLGRMLMAALAYPIFLFMGLISTFRAIGRHVSGRNSWAKTERVADEPPAQQAITAS
jgi:1,2-diacylglycerol 3-beta-glucosyltransferase